MGCDEGFWWDCAPHLWPIDPFNIMIEQVGMLYFDLSSILSNKN